MRWYEYTQNNSGGGFEVTENLAHRLFIEAEGGEEADLKAQRLGVYFDGCDEGVDCPCCGDRWYHGQEVKYPLDYGDGLVFNSVESHAQFLADRYGWTSPDAYIHYANGKSSAIYKSKR